MTRLPEFITAALNGPINYPPRFTEQVGTLAASLSAALGLPCKHGEDMNYNPAQSLSFTFTGTDPEFGKRKLTFEIRFYISSKVPLFAVYCVDTKSILVEPGVLNHPIPADKLPMTARGLIDKARSLLTGAGYREVEHEYFFLPAPGCTTQLDGLPANVFQSLFAEIV